MKKLFIYIVASCLAIFVSMPVAAQYLDGNTRAWGNMEYKEDPWVYNVSRPFFITRGLQNRHLSVWASHGRYYDKDRGYWRWQRPSLFCTTEDLFTQTIVVPYLIPMLENAGAIVFTPRERDWQRHEIIIDNDDAIQAPYYTETDNGKRWKRTKIKGFAATKGTYNDGDAPFSNGTVRQAKATRKDRASEISYQPNIPEEGKYAVYVSYQTVSKSVPDARYIVYHKGQATEFTVNQRMGGGTWVYLGTFEFDKGCNAFNRVVVTNHSSKKGVVTSDAVRFGGGMGNIQRGGAKSGMPRCLEGARYYAQWAGAPYEVYSGKEGKDDYADDINTRSLMTNWLAGGSVYVPAKDGLGVPIELSLAIHSDAGVARDGRSLIGSLAISTTDFNDGVLNSGISRKTSSDFAKALLNNVVYDIARKYGRWNKRYLWDRNYSETRLPEVPSAILETLSHQNFPDMKLAQDPMFRFTLARSIYKTVLRYVSTNHGVPYTVQPLPPVNFSVDINEKGQAVLSWSAQEDPCESTATPTSYNLYIASGTGGFDNGTNITSNKAIVNMEPGVQYNFRVTACNAGGESFPSEVLSAVYRPEAAKTILVVNNFHRLAAPQVIDSAGQQGFDLEADPGVSYGRTAGWNGKQIVFNTSARGRAGAAALGYSGAEMAGKFIAGNDFNYTVTHVEAINASQAYNIVSCSSEAVIGGKIDLNRYACVDLICGLERHDGYTPEFYKTFTTTMQSKLMAYTRGGGALLVSGAYIGSDMVQPQERDFLRNTLKVNYELPTDSLQASGVVNGLGMTFDFHNQLNERHYAVLHPEILSPVESAICAMRYEAGGSAAVGYKGTDYSVFTMAFPFECVKDEHTRHLLMRGILNYIMND